MEEFWADIPRQILRSSRKRIGLPASPDVGILSSTLNILLSKSSPLFSHDEQRSVVISYPSIIALYNEDIVDAAAHLGIIALTGQHIHQPREIVAAYAGYGMGLCESYQNREKCRQEGLEMPSRDMLLVEYTKEAMLLHSTIIREAMDLADPDISAAASFNLGSGNRHSECHTEKVKSLVLELLRKRYHWLGTPGEILVIMTGDAESVSDSAVQQAVQDAVKELGSGVSILTDMPEDVAARGAAELAWRAISLAESG
ncbi:hypothetical protein GQ43DRAFT_441402 [Delitschia confertaspora ATCC 74209]|uniref:Uncharacterized protein n=1 Tax=Delitschia confertaspora ATCC 74209 TaxID=1513339 RepID=A0A9P4MUY4_9PLEO|nr:hypothetical protein GQ43DRAFT_441402 [Delitschia confertaspora ATCC 74209]